MSTATEIVSATVTLTNVDQLVCTLTAWHPRVDIYVDPEGQGALVGAAVFTLSGAPGANTGGGVLGSLTPSRVASVVMPAGTTIAVNARSSVIVPGAVRVTVVGWDPQFQASPVQVTASASHILTPGEPGTFFANVAWRPSVDVFGEASGPLGMGLQYQLWANDGLGHRFFVAAGMLDTVAGEFVIRNFQGGAASWDLYVYAPSSAPLDAVSGTVIAQAAAGTGGGGGSQVVFAGTGVACIVTADGSTTGTDSAALTSSSALGNFCVAIGGSEASGDPGGANSGAVAFGTGAVVNTDFGFATCGGQVSTPAGFSPATAGAAFGPSALAVFPTQFAQGVTHVYARGDSQASRANGIATTPGVGMGETGQITFDGATLQILAGQCMTISALVVAAGKIGGTPCVRMFAQKFLVRMSDDGTTLILVGSGAQEKFGDAAGVSWTFGIDLETNTVNLPFTTGTTTAVVNVSASFDLIETPNPQP